MYDIRFLCAVASLRECYSRVKYVLHTTILVPGSRCNLCEPVSTTKPALFVAGIAERFVP